MDPPTNQKSQPRYQTEWPLFIDDWGTEGKVGWPGTARFNPNWIQASSS